eukprot:145546-Pyramimonas_sp.AAC.1
MLDAPLPPRHQRRGAEKTEDRMLECSANAEASGLENALARRRSHGIARATLRAKCDARNDLVHFV